MMQTVTKESERKWLAEIREISTEAREKVQKEASVSPTKETTDAQNTAGIGRCGDYTTAPRQIQGGIPVHQGLTGKGRREHDGN